MIVRIFSDKLRRDGGTTLVIALLLLAAISLIGVYAVSTSTIETQIAGNERLLEVAFYAADGGTDYGHQMIELVIGNPNPKFPAGANVNDQKVLEDEIRGFADSDPDPSLQPSIGSCNMTIQVGRLKAETLPGGSAEFGSGEGVTKAVYYLVSSTANSVGNAQSAVQTSYRRIVQ